VIVVTTKKCDLRCTHCLRDEYKSPYLDVGLFRDFLRENSKHSTKRLVTLTGGEPTVHPKLDDLLSVCREQGWKVHVVTNGQIKKNRDVVIKNSDVAKTVAISIDAPVREVNDATRGIGTFDKIVEAVHHYRESGLQVNFLFTVHDKNAHLVKESLDLCDELGVKVAMFTAMFPVKKSTADGLNVTNSKAAQAFGKLRLLRPNYKVNVELSDRQIASYSDGYWSTSYCSVINSNLHEDLTLLPDGNVSLCCDLYDLDYDHSDYGQAKNEPLSDGLGKFPDCSYDEIILNKQKLVTELRTRRYQDAERGLLTGQRAFICQNCKFYHYHNSEPKAVPIKLMRKT